MATFLLELAVCASRFDLACDACSRFSRQGDEHSVLGGVEEVLVNPLQPGEEQTVTVMLEAPNFVSVLANLPRRSKESL